VFIFRNSWSPISLEKATHEYVNEDLGEAVRISSNLLDVSASDAAKREVVHLLIWAGLGALLQASKVPFNLRESTQQGTCRYTCFNQRARVSLYCNTYALSIDGCLILLFAAAAPTVCTRGSHRSCALYT
jgi:hypothetical protein